MPPTQVQPSKLSFRPLSGSRPSSLATRSHRSGADAGAKTASPATPSSWLSPKLEGRPCDHVCGHGIVAVQPIRRGELLVVWGGTVLPKQGVEQLPPEQRRLVLQIEEDHYLWSATEGPGDWVNHSCAPNSGLSSPVTLVALRHISPGAWITYDYAMSDGSPYDEFECDCDTARCRHHVTGDDWRNPDLQRRYAGYFSNYLARRIQRLHPPRGGPSGSRGGRVGRVCLSRPTGGRRT